MLYHNIIYTGVPKHQQRWAHLTDLCKGMHLPFKLEDPCTHMHQTSLGLWDCCNKKQQGTPDENIMASKIYIHIRSTNADTESITYIIYYYM